MTKRKNDINGEAPGKPARAQNDRFLFDFSPIALAEEDISELKEHIENLRNRGIEDFRSYFEHHPEEVALCLKKIKLVDVNPAMVRLFEADSKENLLEGGLKFEFDNYDSLKDFREGLIAYSEGKNSFESEGMLQTLTGKKLFLISRWTLSPEPEDSGTRMVFSFVDITGRKAIEDELRTFKAASDRSIVENAIVDLDGTYRYVNEAYARMHGYTREELEGNHASIAHSQEDAEEVARLNEQLMVQGALENVEFFQMKKDGTLFPILVNATIIREENGEPAFISFSMIDNSLRKEAEENLRKFKKISDEAPFGNVILGFDGYFIYMNKAFAYMHGYELNDVADKHVSFFHTEEQMADVERDIAVVLKKGSIANIEEAQEKGWPRFSTLHSGGIITNERGTPLFIAGTTVDISELKEAEKSLRKFKTISDCSAIGNALFDDEGKILYANAAFARMHGYTVEEVIEQHFRVFHTKEQMEIVKKLNETLASQGDMENVEVWHKRKDGTLFPMLVNATLIGDEEGAVLFYSFSGLDISERKEAEEDLRKFKTISDTSSAGNAICDLNGTVIYGNEAIARMHGYTVDEIMGKHFSTFHTEEQFEVVNRLNEELKTQGFMESLEVGNLRKDGSTFPSLINATLMKDTEGNPLYVALSSVDISELKEKEEKLRLFKTVTDRANVGNAITDGEGIILYVNDTLARIYGYEAQELIGQHASILHADDQRKAAARRRRMLTRQGSMENVEIVNKRKDGSVFPALLNSTLIKGDRDEVLFASVSVIDISTLKHVEARLRQREEELKINNLKLKEMNATLKVLLSNREDEKTGLEEKVLTNVKELAMPVLQKLKKCGLGGRAEAYVEVLETSLDEIISPFMHTLASKYMGLTQAELEVANLVKEGKNIKEIGRLMNLSGRSVETYRTRIRKKLGIGGKKVNLRTYLLSFK